MKWLCVAFLVLIAAYGACAWNPSITALEARVATDEQVDLVFSKWMRQHSVTYASNAERARRFDIFRNNLQYILTRNAASHRFKLKMNRFGDMTNDEFMKIHGVRPQLAPQSNRKVSPKKQRDLPTSVDWTAAGKVLPVVNQGQCGSSSLFVATDVLASAYAITYNTSPVALSVDELSDCDSLGGCSGSGDVNSIYQWIINNGGICTAASYKSSNGTCESKACSNFVTLQGTITTNNDSIALSEAVAAGPVSALVQASSSDWQFYSSGILSDPSCGTTVDHAVTITGYGVTEAQEYWMVKNTWGSSWGMNGYIWLAKDDSATGPGECGIASYNQYPYGVRLV